METFQLEWRELMETARRLYGLRLPEAPVFVPFKVAVDLVLAAAPLEPLITKAIDAWDKSQSLVGSFVPKGGEEESETFGLAELHQGEL